MDPAEAVTTREFRITGRAINGRPMDMGRIDEVVTVDEVEIWEVTNADPQPHNFHAHDVQWQVLDINGSPPPPELAGWKDTVYVPPRETVRLIMKFTDYTDPTWPYMFHCHLLWHEDIGLMGQFVVVQPGEQAIPPRVTDTNALGQNPGKVSAAALSRAARGQRLPLTPGPRCARTAPSIPPSRDRHGQSRRAHRNARCRARYAT